MWTTIWAILIKESLPPILLKQLNQMSCIDAVGIIWPNIVISCKAVILILSLQNCQVDIEWLKHMLIWANGLWISNGHLPPL